MKSPCNAEALRHFTGGLLGCYSFIIWHRHLVSQGRIESSDGIWFIMMLSVLSVEVVGNRKERAALPGSDENSPEPN
jgi:hypothetical protein